MKFHPKPHVSADRRPEHRGCNPAEETHLTAAMHLSALVVMVVLFAAMLTIRGC
jgi:hypothetical protein